MVMWIVLSVLTAFAALSVLVPLARARREVASAAAHDAEVYKAQLGEVERDLDRGLISPEAAEAARTEIARRLLAASREAEGSEATAPASAAGRAESRPTPAGRWRLRTVQAIAIAVVPAASLAAYLATGNPDMPDQPLQARLDRPASASTLPELVARVERELARNPNDGRGWDVLAPVYMRLGRPQDAASAYAAALRLLGPDAGREADMGEALVVANSGIVGADARAAFERAVALDPAAVKPRFFLALALTQENRRDEAIAAWQALLGEARGDEPWVAAVRQQLAGLGAAPQIPQAPSVAAPAPTDGAPGPTREEVAAAQDMPAEDRGAMILGMVDRLDARLSEEGGSPDEWLRLMQALGVLGDRPRLDRAVERARAALKDDPAALARIDAAARALGAGS